MDIPWNPLSLLRRYSHGFSADDKVLITAALPIERKGILDFIALAEAMSDVHFMWFGSLGSRLIPKRIRRAIETAPSNVHFAGFISQEELVEAYSGADCFLFMSQEETEGIAVLEALSCGIPAVLRAIPVYSDFMDSDSGIHFFRTLDECMDQVRGVLGGVPEDIAEKERSLALSRDLGIVGREILDVYRDEFNISDEFI